MKIGNLDFSLVPDRTGLRLRILGRPYGLETIVTEDDLRGLAALCVRETEKLSNRKGADDAYGAAHDRG